MSDTGDDVVAKVMAIFSKRKSLFNFGTCGERHTFVDKSVPHRLGIEYPVKRDSVDLGPGKYERDYNTLVYNVDNKICSPKGWSLGARTGPRMEPIKDVGVPEPTRYQKDLLKPGKVNPNSYPFNQKCPRTMYDDPMGKDAPSVGTYTWYEEHKPIEWQRDTNLKPIDLPPITFQSTVPANTKKLKTSHEERDFQRRLRCFENYF